MPSIFCVRLSGFLVILSLLLFVPGRLAALELRVEAGLGFPGHGYHNMSQASVDPETNTEVFGHLDRSYYPGGILGFALVFPLENGNYFDLIGDYHMPSTYRSVNNLTFTELKNRVSSFTLVPAYRYQVDVFVERLYWNLLVGAGVSALTVSDLKVINADQSHSVLDSGKTVFDVAAKAGTSIGYRFRNGISAEFGYRFSYNGKVSPSFDDNLGEEDPQWTRKYGLSSLTHNFVIGMTTRF